MRKPLVHEDLRPAGAQKSTGGVHCFSGRSSDFRIILLVAPSHPMYRQWRCATFVPGYSGGPVPVLHRVPFSSTLVEPENIGQLLPHTSGSVNREQQGGRG